MFTHVEINSRAIRARSWQRRQIERRGHEQVITEKGTRSDLKGSQSLFGLKRRRANTSTHEERNESERKREERSQLLIKCEVVEVKVVGDVAWPGVLEQSLSRNVLFSGTLFSANRRPCAERP